jgi:hypothetical protein
MLKNPIMDRIFFGLAIISAWGLAALFAWVVLFDPQPITWFSVIGALCCFGNIVVALFMTVAAGRYVLTGNEFPQD